ncbi:MAG: hypothetical protein MZV70_32990 [Desulfobacterales bacterium]|nr:hypothetical protein [Desulfobacterales bacterium]
MPETQIKRQAQHPLQQEMVQQRHPNLQRVGHAHPIHLEENIFRQVTAEIDGSEPVAPSRAPGQGLSKAPVVEARMHPAAARENSGRQSQERNAADTQTRRW